MIFNLIVCTDNNYGIGKNNDIPWSFTKDLQYFKKMSIGENLNNKYNVVIMGNNTYKSIPSKYRPLEKRINIALSTSNTPTNNNLLEDIEYIKNNIIYFNNVNYILLYLDKIKNYINDCFIIGGSKIYDIFLNLKLINTIYLTQINNKSYECDIFFNFESYKKQFEIKYSDKYIDFDKKSKNCYILLNYEYSYINKEENKFIKTINKILNKGVYNLDRSGVGTLSIFGKSFTYDIRNYRLPLFTHRKVFLRGIVEELLFFVSGKTDTKILEEKKVNIWRGHTSREFLDSRGLQQYKEGSYGPSYGFQLRHFNADFIDDETYYTGKGFDQLEDVINQIKTNPTSRRILFTYWNPSALNKVPLPSCHILYQFHVNIDTNELSCSFYQRSNDYMLAGVYNICSASILVFMLCHLTGYKPGKIIHNIGNIHIYMNQIEVVKTIIQNKPYNFPLLFIEDPKDEIKKIEDFKYNHFKLLFYNSHKKYNISMAI
jgi:dihydrofolate reductase/thymidylate synthase